MTTILFVFSLAIVQGQATFEASTIRPIDPNAPKTVGVKIYPGGRLTLSAISLKGLICMAFDIPYAQLSGGEPWMEKDQYEIQAKPGAGDQAAIKSLRYSYWDIDDPHLREMLQALVLERFRLKFHRETKTGTVYVLEKGNKPFALTRLEERPELQERQAYGTVEFTGGRWYLFNVSMTNLARHSSRYYLHAPVLDHTGVEGIFTYKEPFGDPDSEHQDSSVSFPRLISGLGLKLTKTTGPIETLVIDHAERPSEN